MVAMIEAVLIMVVIIVVAFILTMFSQDDRSV